jgi:hypothetical protein
MVNIALIPLVIPWSEGSICVPGTFKAHIWQFIIVKTEVMFRLNNNIVLSLTK